MEDENVQSPEPQPAPAPAPEPEPEVVEENPEKAALVAHAAKLDYMAGQIQYPGVTESRSHANILGEMAKDLRRIAESL
jgi:hypothetical protein